MIDEEESESENSADIEFIPARTWDRSINRFGSPDKSRQKLGFQAKTSLEAGIAETIVWTKENLKRIECCMQQHKAFYTVKFEFDD